ncbi:MAG: GIY-YIG nuclease family protein [Nanoarchaeota archaeon]|nr:GIY-YIG nuclease family protein [Nanoarchaeota archaeon]
MKGTYCLVIELKKDSSIKVGALENIKFKNGIYCYVGSALNNLEKRVQRHLSKKKKLHWHIDYFLMNKNTSIKKIFYKQSNKREECKIAKFVLKNSIGSIAKFGCSDCKCESHLFIIKKYDFLEKRLNLYK